MNILVTGGAGYIGTALLVKLGEEFPEATITSLDNLATGNYHYVDHLGNNKRYHLLVGDIRKKSDIQKAITHDTTAIIHAAAIPGVEACNKQPNKAIKTNIYGTHLILEQAVNHNIEKFIFISSAAVYGTPQQQPIIETHPLKPINLYGVTKLAAEKLVNASYITQRLPTTILRVSNAYGLGVYTDRKTLIPKFIWQAIRDKPLTVRADGNQQRNFIHIQDIINAVILCLRASRQAVAGETFNIGGETFSVNQIAKIITKESKQRLNKETLTVFTPLETGEVYTSQFQYSHRKVSRKIGYKPKQKMLKAIPELFNYLLEVKSGSL